MDGHIPNNNRNKYNNMGDNMIAIGNNLIYDETKIFDEQLEDVQSYINQIILAETSVRQTNAFCGRTELETWDKQTYQIIRKYNYLAPVSAKNCFALKNIQITILKL